jgi:hypothetical protein
MVVRLHHAGPQTNSWQNTEPTECRPALHAWMTAFHHRVMKSAKLK